jgi:transposase
VVPEEEGRLSNPVQRRLSEATVDDLVRDYTAGSSIHLLAMRVGVHHTTIMDHLERRGIERRKVVRKMTDRTIRQAVKHDEAGESLKVVAARFAVDARTLAREFTRGGVPIRRRRGWPPST